MNNFFSKLGISGMALTIFLAVMGLLSLYFFVTMEDKREELEKRGFRNLEKLGANMKQRDMIYNRVVTYLAPQLKFTKDNNLPTIPPGSGLAENLKPCSAKDTSALDILFYSLEYNKSVEKDNKPVVETPDDKKMQNGRAMKSLKTPRAVKDSLVVEKQLEETIIKKRDSVFLKISLTEFMKPFLHNRDFFSDYLLIRNNHVAFSTLPGDLKVNSVDVLQGKAKLPETDPTGSLLTAGTSQEGTPLIQSGTIVKITMEGTSYLLFIIPLNFPRGSNSYLGGLIEEKTFSQAKRDVPSELIVAFVFVLMLIIFSFPILKAFIMEPREQLTRPGVTTIGISLATGTLLMGIILSQLMIRYKVRSDQYDQLVSLNSAVKKAFISEKDSILKQLYIYNMQDKEISGLKRPVVSVFDSGSARYSSLNRPLYPFYRNMMWLCKNGKPRTIITPFKYCPVARLNGRNYFTQPDKYLFDSVLFNPGKNKFDSAWYNMESVFQKTTGDWAMAFSMPAQNDSLRIVALTSQMHSLSLPVLQQGMDYCLVNKTGEVWYNSGNMLDVNDSIQKESQKNASLLGALNSNEPCSLDLTIRNVTYHAYISPVPNTDLFVITMLNPDRISTIIALTSMFVLCFFALAFLFLLGGYLLIVMVKGSHSRLAGKEYFFSWLLPVEKHNHRYSRLILINGLVFLLLCGLKLTSSFFQLPMTFLLIFFIILMGIHFIVMRWMLTSEHLHVDDKDVATSGWIFHQYTWFALSWLVIGVVMPAVILTTTLFSDQTGNYLRKQQQYIAHRLNERTELLHESFQEINPIFRRDSLFGVRNAIGHYFMEVDGTRLLPGKVKCRKSEDYYTAPLQKWTLSWFDRIMNDADPIATDPLLECKNPDTTFAGIPLVFNKLEYNAQGEKYVAKSLLVTKNPWSEIYSPYHEGCWNIVALLFWISILLMLGLTGYLIDNLVKLLFLSFDSECDRPPLMQELDKIVESRVNAIVISYNKPGQHLFNDKRWGCFDLEQTPSPGSAALTPQLILLSFESGIDTLENFRKNNQFLEQLVAQNRVMLWLNKTPEQLIEKYRETWTRQEPLVSASAISRFNSLVSGMPHIYPELEPPEWRVGGLCDNLATILSTENQFNPGIKNFELLIRKELHGCSELNALKCPEKGRKTTKCSGVEELILKIQELSSSYYDYIWDSLTGDEQFLLFDLAQDTLLNRKNKKIIAHLIQKGILVNNNRIEFVSQSFRNYILTEIDQASFARMQQIIASESTWGRLKVPLILIGTSIFVFLFITQQNFLSNLNTILISAGALIGVYLKFSGLFTKGKEG